MAIVCVGCVEVDPTHTITQTEVTVSPTTTLTVDLTAIDLTDTPTLRPEPTDTSTSIATIATATQSPTIRPTATNLVAQDESSYPAPESTPFNEAYPDPPTIEPPTPTAEASNGGYPGPFLPIVANEPAETPTNTPPPTATHTPTATPIPTLDFAQIKTDLNGRGVDLQVNKIGFHVGPGGNREGLGDYMRRLDAAGVPVFLKSVGDAGPLFELQQLHEQSGVPHVLVYRFAGNAYDTPNYDLPPQQSAQEHWALHMERWPPELDKDLVWLETLNEVDKNRSEWLALYALETARLAERDGFKWAAFGWSSGEPEISHWEGPEMLRFLRLVADNPDRLAIALHEYSFLPDTITDLYPYKVGRFQLLFDVVDQAGINRPTILITEWGWAYKDVPNPELAIEHIEWANGLYAPYPEIKGGAIWYLGPEFGGVADQAQKLIEPVMIYSLTNYFEKPLPEFKAPINPDQFAPNE